MQLLVAQRLHGGLTIGDTHAYDEPFDFAVDEAHYAHLRARAESLLGRALPPIRRRWSGVYSQALDAVRTIPGVEGAGLISFLPPEVRAGVFVGFAIDGAPAAAPDERPRVVNTLIASGSYAAEAL